MSNTRYIINIAPDETRGVFEKHTDGIRTVLITASSFHEAAELFAEAEQKPVK